MHELDILMYQLQVEGLARKNDKTYEPNEKAHVMGAKPMGRFIPNKKDFKKLGNGKKNPVRHRARTRLGSDP